MERPVEMIMDCQTGEVTVREFTDEEIVALEQRIEQERQERLAHEAEVQAQKEAKESAVAKLLALGLTEEEANAVIN